MGKKVPVALAGCGNIAQEKHIPSLLRIEEAEIVALFDLDRKRAEALVQQFQLKNCEIYQSYEEMLEKSSCEVVHILTPNATHKNLAIKAMEAGKHVLVEKPMALCGEDTAEMLKVSRETGRKLSVSMQNRFRKDSLFVKKMVEQGELGEIYLAKSLALRRRAIPVWGDFLNEEKQGGGAVIDIGVHALDLTLWLMGNYKPTRVLANTYRKITDENNTNSFNSLGSYHGKEMSVEESGFAFILFENGATLLLESSWALNLVDVGEAKCILCGSRAGIDMTDGLRINGELHGQLYDMKPRLTKDTLEYYNDTEDQEKYLEIKGFIQAIAQNQQPPVAMEELHVVTCLIDAIYSSAKSGEAVDVTNLSQV